jgi:integrase/recombinase XerD
MAKSLLFTRSWTGGHTEIPYARERASYLAYCVAHGYARGTVRNKRAYLRFAACILSPTASGGVTAEHLEAAVRHWVIHRVERQSGLAQQIITAARPWLQHVGWWREPEPCIPFEEELSGYRQWMISERGFTSSTVDQWWRRCRMFLQWYGQTRRGLSELQPTDIDRYFVEGGVKNWCRRSVRTYVQALRSFLRYASSQGWCASSLVRTLESPRMYQYEQLPLGPPWADVQRLLQELDTDRPRDVRDYAIVLLLAVYGLRAGEVTRLRLSDLDWGRDRVLVPRVKRRAPQTYPLVATVGNRLARYIQEARPRCPRPEVFLGLRAPHRPLTQGALYAFIGPRLKRLEVALAHWGPHTLRHACARQMLAGGLTLKEIGDHLGHRSAASTQIYAKVDLSALREVAAFDLGELP